MKPNKFIFAVLIILFFSSSPAYGADSAKTRHIIMLVDFSQSVANHANYGNTIRLVTGCPQTADEQSLERICGKLREGDRVTIVKITGESGRKTEIISDLSIDKIGSDENELGYQMRIRENEVAFLKKITASLAAPPSSRNTEILSAIRTAKLYFDNSKADKKILVILSDMIEDSEYANFEKNRVNSADIINKEKKEGRLPDLKGIKVFISGATAKTDQKFNEIKSFWIEYFKSTNAIFSESSYFSEMLDFNE